ncbi:MAG: ATPase F0F1 [Desulfobacteraceae bacterium]|nr:MAG: ATPase F0F1 [Desulfobacteraceae bacterium]
MNGRSLRKMPQEVGRKESRKLKARGRKRGVWFGLGMFGLVGWAVAIPTLLGVILGLWLDRRWPASFSWTLTLLFVGVILGCLNAWFWVKREMREE